MTDKEIIEKIVELMPSAVVKAYDYTVVETIGS